MTGAFDHGIDGHSKHACQAEVGLPSDAVSSVHRRMHSTDMALLICHATGQ